MFVLQDSIRAFEEGHPVAGPVVCFVVVLVILLAIIWFFLFSGLNASADFVYNQF